MQTAFALIISLFSQPDPFQGGLMDEMLDKLKLEADRERAERYLERFGMIPDAKEENNLLRDINN